MVLPFLGDEMKKPAFAFSAGGLLADLWLALVLTDGVRRHVRHMVMVRMTMMGADLHPVQKL
jgi:hypothetical protein